MNNSNFIINNNNIHSINPNFLMNIPMNQINFMNQPNNNINNMNQPLNGMIQPLNNIVQPMKNNVSCPVKGIFNKTNIIEVQETTFINSVLQSLSSLNCIKNWYYVLNLNKNHLMSNNNSSITKEFYILLFSLYTGQQPDSTNIILNFNNKLRYLYDNIQIQQDPYNFIYYFLDLLHLENNNPLVPNFNLNDICYPCTENMRNKEFMFNLYKNFFENTQNSIISHNFYSILKYKVACNNCPPVYNYTSQTIFEFNVDLYIKYRNEAFPQTASMNLNMDACFTCFTGGKQCRCDTCGNNNASMYINICSPSKVLILAFKREKHSYHCDITFGKQFNISKYISTDSMIGINSNTIYALKACISLNNNNQYFADICINNIWFRFLNNQITMLGNVNNDIHIFEPQLLIYELEEEQNNQMQQMMLKKIQMNQLRFIGEMNLMKQNILFANLLKIDNNLQRNINYILKKS